MGHVPSNPGGDGWSQKASPTKRPIQGGLVQVKRTFRLPARLLICAAALAGSASVAVVTVPGTASASSLTVTCTKLTGTATTSKLSGCSGSGVTTNEATATATTTVASNDKSGTIKWTDGKTTVETFTYKVVTPTKCPSVAGQTVDLEVSEAGSVTGGTAKGLIGGKLSGKVCIYEKSKKVDLVNSVGSLTL